MEFFSKIWNLVDTKNFQFKDNRGNFFKEYGDVDEETKLLARLIAIFIPILIMLQAIDDRDEKLVDEAKRT
ncbi:hypothetical protein [Paenibacillus sp. N3.4]|uniref:hypothetical protein n=1 Tax=Paenibacillus sp. N3.4 TaxID=2603222 RepID=UPI00164F09B1|nr:hypothetical protein [Paenibacillus sp. N3.4]